MLIVIVFLRLLFWELMASAISSSPTSSASIRSRSFFRLYHRYPPTHAIRISTPLPPQSIDFFLCFFHVFATVLTTFFTPVAFFPPSHHSSSSTLITGFSRHTVSRLLSPHTSTSDPSPQIVCKVQLAEPHSGAKVPSSHRLHSDHPGFGAQYPLGHGKIPSSVCASSSMKWPGGAL